MHCVYNQWQLGRQQNAWADAAHWVFWMNGKYGCDSLDTLCMCVCVCVNRAASAGYCILLLESTMAFFTFENIEFSMTFQLLQELFMNFYQTRLNFNEPKWKTPAILFIIMFLRRLNGHTYIYCENCAQARYKGAKIHRIALHYHFSFCVVLDIAHSPNRAYSIRSPNHKHFHFCGTLLVTKFRFHRQILRWVHFPFDQDWKVILIHSAHWKWKHWRKNNFSPRRTAK